MLGLQTPQLSLFWRSSVKYKLDRLRAIERKMYKSCLNEGFEVARDFIRNVIIFLETKEKPVALKIEYAANSLGDFIIFSYHVPSIRLETIDESDVTAYDLSYPVSRVLTSKGLIAFRRFNGWVSLVIKNEKTILES